MSVVALLNESIPHTLASLVTHMIATAWAAFQIAHTADFKSNFSRVITNGACGGLPMSLLPSYWRDRGVAEWTSLAFNVLALLISSFLTFKLFKVIFPFALIIALSKITTWMVVLWMADVQARRSFVDYQSHL